MLAADAEGEVGSRPPRPLATAVVISEPTPSVSSDSKGETARIPWLRYPGKKAASTSSREKPQARSIVMETGSI